MRAVSIIFASCLFTCVSFCQEIGFWDGEVDGTVRIRVLSEDDGKAICGVQVWLLTGAAHQAYLEASLDHRTFAKVQAPLDEFGSGVATDGDGQVTIRTRFYASGSILVGGKKTTHRFIHGTVVVKDTFGDRFEWSLDDLVSKDQETDDLAPIPVTIKLKQKANQALQHNDPSCHESCLRTPRASRSRG
jgi:hypothetical protein